MHDLASGKSVICLLGATIKYASIRCIQSFCKCNYSIRIFLNQKLEFVNVLSFFLLICYMPSFCGHFQCAIEAHMTHLRYMNRVLQLPVPMTLKICLTLFSYLLIVILQYVSNYCSKQNLSGTETPAKIYYNWSNGMQQVFLLVYTNLIPLESPQDQTQLEESTIWELEALTPSYLISNNYILKKTAFSLRSRTRRENAISSRHPSPVLPRVKVWGVNEGTCPYPPSGAGRGRRAVGWEGGQGARSWAEGRPRSRRAEREAERARRGGRKRAGHGAGGQRGKQKGQSGRKARTRGKFATEGLLYADYSERPFQELDEFETFYKGNMDKQGYSSVYIQRSGRKRDGCGIFYKHERAELVLKQDIEYNDLVPPDEDPVESFEAKDEKTSRSKSSTAASPDNNSGMFPKRKQSLTSSSFAVFELIWRQNLSMIKVYSYKIDPAVTRALASRLNILFDKHLLNEFHEHSKDNLHPKQAQLLDHGFTCLHRTLRRLRGRVRVCNTKHLLYDKRLACWASLNMSNSFSHIGDDHFNEAQNNHFQTPLEWQVQIANSITYPDINMDWIKKRQYLSNSVLRGEIGYASNSSIYYVETATSNL
eukprot:Gb_28231 [translate_table: standard]